VRALPRDTARLWSAAYCADDCLSKSPDFAGDHIAVRQAIEAFEAANDQMRD
jgi:hypothetical protein